MQGPGGVGAAEETLGLMRRHGVPPTSANYEVWLEYRLGGNRTLAEAIDAQPEQDQRSVRDLAEALVAKLKEGAPAIGLDIGRLTALEVQLGKITVTSGTGARIEEANVGTFKTGDISVGDRSGK